MKVAPQIGVIAAGGKGSRLQPFSIKTPKVMLQVGGKALLTRQIELMRDMLGISKIILIIGYHGDYIRQAYGTGGCLGIEIRYVDNPDIDGGLGTVLRAAERHVQEPFVLLLGDEFYFGSNHASLTAVSEAYTAVCGIIPTKDIAVIRKNYAVTLQGSRISSLIEKPESMPTPFVGCGTYLLDPEIYRDARETGRSLHSGRLELTDILNHAAHRGASVLSFVLSGQYVNVNTVQDLRIANEMCWPRSLDPSQFADSADRILCSD